PFWFSTRVHRPAQPCGAAGGPGGGGRAGCGRVGPWASVGQKGELCLGDRCGCGARPPRRRSGQRPGRGEIVPTLTLPPVQPVPNGHNGEVFTCSFTPDGAFALSGGWDGHLRLWDSSTGAAVTGLAAGGKAVSACAVAPSGKFWLSGSLDG